MVKWNLDAQERRFRAQFVRRAIQTGADLLAPRLHRYAAAEGLTWQQLAHALGIEEDALNQIALCPPPRSERFVADSEEIAGEYADIDRLLPLLRRLQVLDALSHQEEIAAQRQDSHSEAALLAARDREEKETTPSLSEAVLPASEDDHA